MKTDQLQIRFSRPLQIILLILVNLVIFLIILYGLELYLALTDPKSKLPPRPVEVTNSYGFRERGFAVPKPSAGNLHRPPHRLQQPG